MSGNQTKKLLLVESSDNESSIPTEQNSVEKTALEQGIESNKIISSSQSILSKKSSSNTSTTSSSIPSTSTQQTLDSLSDISIPNKSNLEDEFKSLNCDDENFYTTDCNKFLLKKELIEREYLSENEDNNDYLYPNLNDNKFNVKIATKKEFNDTRYDGTIYEDIKKTGHQI